MRFPNLKQVACAFALLAAAVTAAPAPVAALEGSAMQTYSPPNDDFAGALTLAAALQLFPGDLAYATRELGEAKLSASSWGRTVWFKYTATQTGRAVVFVTKRSSPAPFQLSVFTGTKISDLKRVGYSQIAGTDTDYSGAVGFDAVKDTAYYFQVDRATMSYNYVTTFLIGVRPVAATGYLATFVDQQMIFQESDFDYRRKAYVANGYSKGITLTSALSNLDGYISATTTNTTLAPNGTTVFGFSDLSKDFPDGSVNYGSLDLISKVTGTSTILGQAVIPIRVISTEYTNKPALEARFVDGRQGAPVGGNVKSVVHVRNTASTTALGCRFDTPYYADENSLVSVSSREVLPTGYGNFSPIFSILPNTTRKFEVYARVAANDYDRYVRLRCANYYGTFVDNYSAYMAPTSYRGIYPNLKINPKTDNNFGEVKVADFASRKVMVVLTNAGEYSGYFQIRAYDDTYQDRAVITEMCISNAAGTCVEPSNTDVIQFDMAKGEARWLAVTVRRGNSTPGEVRLWAQAIDIDDYDDVGLGAFTVMK